MGLVICLVYLEVVCMLSKGRKLLIYLPSRAEGRADSDCPMPTANAVELLAACSSAVDLSYGIPREKGVERCGGVGVCGDMWRYVETGVEMRKRGKPRLT